MDISHQLLYMINHVFIPPKLPQKDDLDAAKEHALCSFVHQAAEAYCNHLSVTSKRQWVPMLKMLKNICISSEQPELSTDHITLSMGKMTHGDVFALLIRAQNAGFIMRKLKDCTMFESFEVSPEPEAVMTTKGRLLCSYPGPAVTVPENIVSDPSFCEVLASFIVQMNVDVLDSTPETRKARSRHVEERATAHPRYITELLSGILRGLGEPAMVTRIQKRIGDDVLWHDASKPWRRSSIWLVIRVALQTSLLSEENNHSEYKAFMIYMMARMVAVCLHDRLPSHLLFCMRAKMSRRLYKVASDVPEFVLEYVRKICGGVETLLQSRWSVARKDQNTSPPWMPKELNFTNDTRLTLLNSKSYLSKVLHDKLRSDTSNKFHSTHHQRLHGFEAFEAFDNQALANLFKADTYVALADFELAVQEHLDDWVSNNLDRGFGCPTISSCITQYYEAANTAYSSNPEDMSLMLLTIFDLLVGLDKMAVAQCPLLAEYSPEIPDRLLDRLLLRRSKSFKRLKSIQEYLRERHRCATFGSVFADRKHSSSFEVRYVDQSEEHKSLLFRILTEARQQRDNKLTELSKMNDRYKHLKDQSRALNCEYRFKILKGRFHAPQCRRCQLNSQADSMQIEVHEWPLPEDTFEAKATVFELRLPIPFSIWRDTVFKVLYDICAQLLEPQAGPSDQVRSYIGLRKYVGAQESRITIASSTKSFICSHYRTTRIPSDSEKVCVNNGLQYRIIDNSRGIWAANKFSDCNIARYCTLQLLPQSPYKFL